MSFECGEKIRLSCSSVGAGEVEAISKVLLYDKYLGMGSEVRAFEKEIADFLGVTADSVVCVNSGTAAVHLATQAVTQRGDEALVQSLTYVATFQAVKAAGAIPIACDVDQRTVTLDLKDAQRKTTQKTRVVLPVHYASNPGNLKEIYIFAKKNGLVVIEDAAHAFGCRYDNKKIGSFGDIVCFSFDGIKNITSGEGGAIVVRDYEIAEKIRSMRLLGVENDTDWKFAGERKWEFDVRNQGYRYHMSNILAALGRVQLRRFSKEFAPKRIFTAMLYKGKLYGVSGIEFLDIDIGNVIPHIQPIRVTNNKRDALREFLERSGIETGIHYKPNHLLRYFGSGKPSLPVTEKLYSELLSLPMHPLISEAHVIYITDKIKEFMS